MLKKFICAAAVAAAVASVGAQAPTSAPKAPAAPKAPRPANELTAAEKAQGWKLLFDGKTTDGWRGFNKPDFPKSGWSVEDGWLENAASTHQDKFGGGDIVTTDTFDNFDLRFEWKISQGGNSGVKYLVDETRKGGAIAHEYQIIDDERHADAKIGPHRQTASLYDVIPAPAGKPIKPAGEINEGRILVDGNHVEHWLNGKKLIEYELDSPALKAGMAKSKFKDVKGWESKLRGPILLQDHGDEVAFRNIKIRELPAKGTR